MFGRNTDIIRTSAFHANHVDAALRLLSDTQSALTPTRADNAKVIDAFGSVALDEELPAAVKASFQSDVIAKIDAFEASHAKAKEAAHAAGAALSELLALPQPLRDVSLEAAGQSGWTFAGPGLKSMKLQTGGKLVARLIRIESGFGAPNHDHTGTEYTLVVKGAFHDGHGRFGPGDLSIKRAGQIHHPIAEAGEVCFALTVEEGEVAFTGALGMLQRLLTRH